MTGPKSAPNEFWLCLHRLAESYENEGLGSDERIENILAEFRDLPHVARRQILDEFRKLANDFPDLFSLAVAADRLLEEKAKGVPRKGIA